LDQFAELGTPESWLAGICRIHLDTWWSRRCQKQRKRRSTFLSVGVGRHLQESAHDASTIISSVSPFSTAHTMCPTARDV